MKSGLNLDALIILDAIARRASFAAAAEELHRVPSSITYSIHKLENDLGVTLFDRRGHRAQLTEAGKMLLNEGRHLLAMANNVQRNVQQIATGWETELRIAVDTLIPYAKVLDLCEAFYQYAPDTRLQLTTEVLGGAWDALISGRADLVIGASGDAPSGGGYTRKVLGEIEFVFAIAPQHPLAQETEPLANTLIRQYRAVAAADSSRQLPPKTVGLLSGQAVLTVPDLNIKCLAQKQGLGVGYLPRHMITKDLQAGNLIVKATEDGESIRHTLYYVWRTRHQGKALAWFKEQLCSKDKKIDWFT
ncbi:MAG: LysR family transcriptional regulator [Methylococcales bacterium]